MIDDVYIKLDKQMIIHALKGNGFPDMIYAEKMVSLGLAKFTGDQWNENWDWKTKTLEEMSAIALFSLYESALLQSQSNFIGGEK